MLTIASGCTIKINLVVGSNLGDFLFIALKASDTCLFNRAERVMDGRGLTGCRSAADVSWQDRIRCKTLCDVLYDTLGEFGAIQAQAVAKIYQGSVFPLSYPSLSLRLQSVSVLSQGLLADNTIIYESCTPCPSDDDRARSAGA